MLGGSPTKPDQTAQRPSRVLWTSPAHEFPKRLTASSRMEKLRATRIKASQIMLMKVIQSISLFLLFGCHKAAFGCTPLNTVITLTGIVTISQQYGPPNFGETPQTDSKMLIPVLQLDSPARLCSMSSEKFGPLPTIIDKIQLVQQEHVKIKMDTHASITGKLAQSENALHYTPVILVVDSVSYR